MSPAKDGALLKKVVTAGTGDAIPDDVSVEVKVHYTGYLLDGSKFDSSRDRDEQFSFKLGAGQVIKGWDVGVATMRIGEQARFRIRSDFAYGDNGSPPKIPGGATLVFDVELFSFEQVKKKKYEFSKEDKIAKAAEHKELGNTEFKVISGAFVVGCC